MGETPEQFFDRVMASARDDGAFPMPPVADWVTFPFRGELSVRPLSPPSAIDRPRSDEDPADCWRCDQDTEGAIWYDDDWQVTSLGRPSGLPVVVILFPREHHDIDDLPDRLVSRLGEMIVRVEAAVRSVGGIGRVHVGRWGDGSAHLHWWFMARPSRIPQLVGSFAAIWDDILPPLPEAVWRQNLSDVAAALAHDGGVTTTG